MVLNIYSIRDTFTGYGQLFLDSSDPVAVRGFRFALSKKDSPMFTDPNDYELMRLGTFDSETGVINFSPAVTVCTAASIRREFD